MFKLISLLFEWMRSVTDALAILHEVPREFKVELVTNLKKFDDARKIVFKRCEHQEDGMCEECQKLLAELESK